MCVYIHVKSGPYARVALFAVITMSKSLQATGAVLISATTCIPIHGPKHEKKPFVMSCEIEIEMIERYPRQGELSDAQRMSI